MGSTAFRVVLHWAAAPRHERMSRGYKAIEGMLNHDWLLYAAPSRYILRFRSAAPRLSQPDLLDGAERTSPI
jgi:hypothetical protein